MSRTFLPDKYLEKTVNIYNNEFTRNNTGEEIKGQVLIYSSVATNIQIKSSLVEYKLQGLVHYQTHKAYLNKYDSSNNLRKIEAGYIIFDTVNLINYLVIGVEENNSFNTAYATGGYYKLILEQQADQDSYSIRITQDLKSKANIEEEFEAPPGGM